MHKKRPVAVGHIENLVNRISRYVQGSPDMELAANKIGQAVMKELKVLDDVAYVRFASVYKSFKDVNEFMQTLKRRAHSRERGLNMSGTRRLSRELALQVLFQQEFAPKQSIEAGLDNFKRSFAASSEVWGNLHTNCSKALSKTLKLLTRPSKKFGALDSQANGAGGFKHHASRHL